MFMFVHLPIRHLGHPRRVPPPPPSSPQMDNGSDSQSEFSLSSMSSDLMDGKPQVLFRRNQGVAPVIIRFSSLISEILDMADSVDNSSGIKPVILPLRLFCMVHGHILYSLVVRDTRPMPAQRVMDCRTNFRAILDTC